MDSWKVIRFAACFQIFKISQQVNVLSSSSNLSSLYTELEQQEGYYIFLRNDFNTVLVLPGLSNEIVRLPIQLKTLNCVKLFQINSHWLRLFVISKINIASSFRCSSIAVDEINIFLAAFLHKAYHPLAFSNSCNATINGQRISRCYALCQ